MALTGRPRAPIALIPRAAHIRSGWLRAAVRAVRHAPLLFVLTAFFVYPTAMLVVGAFHGSLLGGSGGWTLTGFVDAYTSSTTYQTLINSVIFVAGVTVLAVGVGAIFAWIATQTNVPGRGLITPLMILSLVVPPLLYAFGWILLANGQTGMVNTAIQAIFNTQADPINVQTPVGVILVGGIVTAPIAYLLVLGPFMHMDQSLEDAARTSGANRFTVLWRVTMPVLTPALLGVATLVVVLGLQSFDVPQLLGVPANFLVFATQIFHEISDFTPPHYSQGNSLGLLLLAVIVVLLIVQRKALGGRDFVTVSGKSHRDNLVELKRSRFALAAVLGVYFLVTLGLPIAAVVVGAFQPIFGVFDGWTLANFTEVVNDPTLRGSIILTIWLSALGGFVAMVFAVIAARIIRRGKPALRAYTQLATFVPWSMPGVVLALSFLWSVTAISFVSGLYGTTWLMLIALIVGTAPIAVTVAVAALSQIDPELEEAARVSGAPPMRAFALTTGRLIVPSFLAGWFLCALFISGNLSVPIVLSAPGAQPVATTVYQFYENGTLAEAAAFYCIMFALILLVCIAVGVARVVLRRMSRARVGGRQQPMQLRSEGSYA